MYGIFTYIYHENQPNVGKYAIHGSSGNLYRSNQFTACFLRFEVFTLPVVWMKTLVLGPMFWPSVKALLPRRRSVPQKASQHDLVGEVWKKVTNLLICVTCCSMLDKSWFVMYKLHHFFWTKPVLNSWIVHSFLNILPNCHSSLSRLGQPDSQIQACWMNLTQIWLERTVFLDRTIKKHQKGENRMI